MSDEQPTSKTPREIPLEIQGKALHFSHSSRKIELKSHITHQRKLASTINSYMCIVYSVQHGATNTQCTFWTAWNCKMCRSVYYIIYIDIDACCFSCSRLFYVLVYISFNGENKIDNDRSNETNAYFPFMLYLIWFGVFWPNTVHRIVLYEIVSSSRFSSSDIFS